MTDSPRPGQRSRLGSTPGGGRARLRQPFRSPLLMGQSAGPHPVAQPFRSPLLTSQLGGSPVTAAAGPRSVARPFRSPLLARRQGGTPTSAPDRLRSHRQDSAGAGTGLRGVRPADSAASPVLGSGSAGRLPRAPDAAAASGRTDPEVSTVEPDGAGQLPPRTADESAEQDAEVAAADAEIARLEAAGCRVEQLPLYITALHDYNEVKDAAQLVMGRIAELDGVTVRAVHHRYSGLPSTEWS